MYKQLLFATDLSSASFNVGRKAQQIANSLEATISIAHIVEPPILYSHDFAVNDKLLKERLTQAKKMLTAFAAELGIAPALQHIAMGPIKEKIIDLANTLKADLIVVGSQGVGGYTQVLGSTAHNILNHAHCDVLTINVKALPLLEKSINESCFAQPATEHPHAFKLGYSRHDDKTLKDMAAPPPPSSKLFGSKKGVVQAAHKGPKPGLRPPSTPFGRPGDEGEEDKDA